MIAYLDCLTKSKHMNFSYDKRSNTLLLTIMIMGLTPSNKSIIIKISIQYIYYGRL